MDKREVIQQLLPKSSTSLDFGQAWAPINIALCKYWGKEDSELNIPKNSSLSITLEKGTKTEIKPAATDIFSLNGEVVATDSKHFVRLFRYLDHFRTASVPFFEVNSWNEIPTRAGLASSASAFAALVLAMNQLFQWGLSYQKLSILARLGSGSACRSIQRGFALWHKGVLLDGSDSYATQLDIEWPELRAGVLLTSTEEKLVGSTEGMLRTVVTSPLYAVWPAETERQVVKLQESIEKKNFEVFGQIIESNAMMMHATMLASTPPLFYWNCETLRALQKIWELRTSGVAIYPTLDAGPNVKLFYMAAQEEQVQAAFPLLLPLRPLFRCAKQ